MEPEAFHLFGQLKNKYSDDKETLGIVYSSMGDALLDVDLFDSCDAVMQEAITCLGEEEDLMWIRLQCLVNKEDKPATLELAQRIQHLNPLSGENWNRLGDVYREIDELALAIDALENAISLGFVTRENLLTLIFVYEENNNPSKALERTIEYLNRFESDFYLYFTAAKLCGQLEDWTSALDFINEAIRLEPMLDESVYIYKSSFLLNLDEKHEAKMALKEGIRNTDDPDGALKKELKKLNKQYPEKGK